VPMMRFTDKAIANLRPPKSGQTDYYDTAKGSESGFGLRVSHSGTKTWFLKYVAHGKQARKSLRTVDGSTAIYASVSLAEARRLAKEWRDTLRREGITPSEKKALRDSLPTFEALAQQFIEEYAEPNKRSWREDERILKRYFRLWHDRKPVDISRADLVSHLQKIKRENGPIMSNRCLASVRKMYSWAIRNAHLDMEFNPFIGIDAPGKEAERDRVYTDDEVRRLWKWFGDIGIPGQVFRFKLVTGQRLMECALLNKRNELADDLWTIPAARTKNRRPHVVPLSDLAHQILKETPVLDETWAFPSPRREGQPIRNFGTARRSIRRLSGIGDFTAHDLRRTCMTGITRLGFSRFVADQIANHVQPGVGRVYDRYDYMKEKAEALDAWARHLRGLIGSGENLHQLVI